MLGWADQQGGGSHVRGSLIGLSEVSGPLSGNWAGATTGCPELDSGTFDINQTLRKRQARACLMQIKVPAAPAQQAGSRLSAQRTRR